MVSQKSLSYFKTNFRKGSATLKVFHPGSYEGFYTLVGHHNVDTSNSLFWILLCSCIHLRTLQKSGYFGFESTNKRPEDKLDQNELFIASVLVDSFRSLRYNMHAIVEQVKKQSCKDNAYSPSRIN